MKKWARSSRFWVVARFDVASQDMTTVEPLNWISWTVFAVMFLILLSLSSLKPQLQPQKIWIYGGVHWVPLREKEWFLFLIHFFHIWYWFEYWKLFISTFKASIFMSGIQTPTWVVKLLIKYVTCFNFSKSISQSIIPDVFGRKKIENRLLFY